MTHAFLPDAFDDRVNIGRRTFHVNPAVSHVFAAERALSDEHLLPQDRLRLAVWHLFRRPRPRATETALSAAFDLLRTEPPYPAAGSGAPVLDLRQDAVLIVAAFRQQYGIDLPAAAAHMDWRLFQMLLSGITEATRLGEIMQLRGTPLPKRTAYNSEQVQTLLRLKAIYAIRQTNDRRSWQDGLRGMAQLLEALCETRSDKEVI